MNLCQCGCRQEVNNKFVKGHWIRLNHPMKNIESVRKMVSNHPLKNPEIAKKVGIARKRYLRENPDKNPMKNPESRKKVSLSKMGDKNPMKNPEYKKRMVEALMESRRLKPNKSELYLFEIIKSINLGFEYTGDFSFFIDGKNPDFVNKKSKKLIEFFGNYWHDIKEEVPRLNHFYDNGWECIVIWESEMKDIGGVKQRIEEFVI